MPVHLEVQDEIVMNREEADLHWERFKTSKAKNKARTTWERGPHVFRISYY